MTGSDRKLICVTTDYVEPDMNWEIEEYKSSGITYQLYQMRGASPEELTSVAVDADVLVVDQAKITRELIESIPACRLIIRHGDGYDNLDIAAATENGIVCANEPGFWSREVAEQAFAMALSLIIKLPIQESIAQKGSSSGWQYKDAMPYNSLASRTVGIIGYGKIGIHTVELFAPVVNRILVHDPLVDPSSIGKAGATPVPLKELLGESDVICIHLPATPETVGLFDAELIGKIKRGAILINVSRGSIVHTGALVDALNEGRLSGAGLDATNPEPLPPDHPLFSTPNVIVTPHMGWYSEDALWNLRKQVVADVKAAGKGKLPLSVVNPDVLEQKNLRLG